MPSPPKSADDPADRLATLLFEIGGGLTFRSLGDRRGRGRHLPASLRPVGRGPEVVARAGRAGDHLEEVRAFGAYLESWLVDRFSISTTTRHGKPAQVDPSSYPEDWDLLTEKLVSALRPSGAASATTGLTRARRVKSSPR